MQSKDDDFSECQQLFSDCFNIDQINEGKSIELLKEKGGSEGICELLRTSLTDGLDSSSINFREKFFGKNEGYSRERESIFAIMWDALGDTVIQILIAAAVVSLIIGCLRDPEGGWVEGCAILIAVVIVVAVTTTNDYIKDGQFIKLSKSINLFRVTVTRDGREQEIPASSLVVGDLMHIAPGEVLDVDGILIKSTTLKVDESLITGESFAVYKTPLTDQESKANPFLISGSKIIEGYGLMIVCGVGLNSINEKIRQMSGVENEDEKTPLQERLEQLAELLGKIGLAAGLALTLILLIYACIEALKNSEWTDDETSEVVSAIIIGITILVVAIPEGLPLALTLSMAYSVIRMKEENIFVRHIRGCEIMGAATNILTDKTGTLTENKMKITAAVLYDSEVKDISKMRLSKDQTNLLCKSISRNTTAFFKTVNGIEEISGSKTEGAMIDLVKSLGKDLYDYRDIKEELFKFAFTSDSKKMTTVYNLYNEGAEVYTKGAAEVVIDLCKQYYTSTFETEDLTEAKREELTKTIDRFAKRKLRVLALAHRIYDQYDPSTNKQEDFEQNLVLIGIVGMEDTIRKEVIKSVSQVQNAGVVIRMVTGDSVDTALSVAQATGLIPQQASETELNESVITGKDFREKSGGMKCVKDEKGEIVEFSLNDKDQFNSIIGKVKVIARCSPEDKLLLTIGLKELGEVVAVIGDGSNDAAALKQSDLGIAMMSGTQLAKQSSDIILLDDNFYNVLNSIKWGRNVYACTRKFLQFQLTVNIVALCCTIIGGITVQAPPITAVQMLWVNLIMDSFAALALATEPPSMQLLDSRPFGRKENIIIRDMIITVASQSVFQITILLVILYLGPNIFDVDPGWDSDDWSENNAKHFTIFFHTFVMLQLFNEINCRKIHMIEVNVFKDFFNNWMFQFIFGVTFVVQVVFVQFGGEFMGCAGLNFWQHLVCIGLGSCALVFGIAVRYFVVLYRTRHFKEAKRKERYDDEYTLLKNEN